MQSLQVGQVNGILVRDRAAVIAAAHKSPLTASGVGAAHNWGWDCTVSLRKEPKSAILYLQHHERRHRSSRCRGHDARSA